MHKFLSIVDYLGPKTHFSQFWRERGVKSLSKKKTRKKSRKNVYAPLFYPAFILHFSSIYKKIEISSIYTKLTAFENVFISHANFDLINKDVPNPAQTV